MDTKNLLPRPPSVNPQVSYTPPPNGDTEAALGECKRLYASLSAAREELSGVAFLLQRSVYLPLKESQPPLAEKAFAAVEKVSVMVDELAEVAAKLRSMQHSFRY